MSTQGSGSFREKFLMGIKFNCHACGKKLNVKTFLAGKRGICPHCGAKIDIPADAENAQPGFAAVPQSVVTRPSAMPNTPAPVEANGVGATAVPVRPAAPVASAGPAMSPQATPATPVGVPSTAPVTPTPEPTPQPQTPADPIDESPQSVWYVRPPSGGQFGPAAGDIMRRWLAEGRVSNDSLVWREGWADWQTASVVFPQLGGSTPPPPGSPATGPSLDPNSSVSTQPSTPGRAYPRRKSSNTLAMVLVVILTFAALGLIILFLMVISGAFGTLPEVPQT